MILDHGTRVGANPPARRLNLDTGRANPIPNEQAQTILQPLAAARIEASVQHPSIVRATAHPWYNCHGLTFGSRRTGIHPNDPRQILQDDGYQRVEEAARVLPGDCVLYYDSEGRIEHSAIVVTAPEPPLNIPIVVSKWGHGGPEIIHRVTNCKYAVGDLRYYRMIP